MADVLDSLSFHYGALRGARSRLVTIRRGAAVASDIAATIGMTPVGKEISPGVLQTWQSVDFLVARTDLVWDGETEPFEPEVGMNVEFEAGDGVTRTYEVNNGDDGRCAGFTDETTCQTWRIKTKQIG